MYNSDLNDSDNLEYEEVELLNTEEVDSENMLISQIPSILPWQILRPGQPALPNAPAPPSYGQPPRTTPSFINQPPRTPPPSSTPQLPRGMALPNPGTSEFNLQYDNFNNSYNLDRQFRSCLNRFTFVWMWYGRSFWFYPINIRRRSVDGFIWYRNRWIFNSINLNSIFFYRCF
jgi:hypothetical protein